MTPNELDVWTLVAFHASHRLLLTERSLSGQRVLPTIAIRKYSRFAEEITEAIRRNWCTDAIVHFRPQLDGTAENWAVITIERLDLHCGVGLEWSQEDAVPDPCLRSVLAQWKSYETGECRGPFACRGWRSELEAWVDQQIRPLGLRLTGNLRQYNASPTFGLIRMETDRAALWFKATGAPNVHEFEVTRELAGQVPEFLPQVIAFHAEWNGWLMREVKGEPIDVSGTQVAWTRAATSLAAVQTRLFTRRSILERIGCHDRSLAWASANIDPFFRRAEEWMHRQPAGTNSRPLSPSELRGLKGRSCELLGELWMSGIQDTLVHGDLNSGNIFVSADSCVFLDWAEAWISQPFFSFEYLKELLRRGHPDRPDWMKGLYDAYALPWREFYENAQIEKLFSLSPAAAALIYALVCAQGPEADLPDNPRREAFLRSLIRRVDRETRDVKTGVAA